MKQILSLVKYQCKLCGVKFIVKQNYCHLGAFSESDKTLTIARHFTVAKGKRKGKPRLRRTSDDQFLLTALHEMVHMLQWKRKDSNWISKLRLENGESIYLHEAILYYVAGEENFDKETLIASAKATLSLELEAELTSIGLLDLFGIPQNRCRNIRDAKAYAYSYLVLAHTGIMPDRIVRSKWYKSISNLPESDITSAGFKKMCAITVANPRTAYTIWEKGVCVKASWDA